MICKNCSSENENSAKFCLNCGANLEEQRKNEVDQEETVDNLDENIEEDISEDSEEVVEAVLVDENEEDNTNEEGISIAEIAVEEEKKESKKVFGILKFIIPIGIILAIFMFFKGSKGTVKGSSRPLVYSKDNAIYLHNEKKKEPILIEENLINSNISGGSIKMYEHDVFFVNDDNSAMVYLAQINDSQGYISGVLKYKEFKKLKDKNYEGIELARGVIPMGIKFVNDGKDIIYYKNVDKATYKATLYRHNLSEEMKISSDVGIDYVLYEDINKILYTKIYEGEATKYLLDLKTFESDKIDKDIQDIEIVGDKIYYSKQHDDYKYNIYLKDGDKPSDKIVSNISYMISASEKGVIYYDTDNIEKEFDELVVYNEYEQDKNVVEPNSDDYSEEVEYESFFGGTYTRNEVDYDAYYEAYDKYQEAQHRLSLREEYEGDKVTESVYNVYLYNNKGEEEKLASGIGSIIDISEDGEKILYSKLNENNERVNINDIYSIYDLHYNDELEERVDIIYLEKGKEEVVVASDVDLYSEISVTDDFKSFFIVNNDEGYELVKYYIDGKKDKESIDTEVIEFDILDESGDDLLYIVQDGTENLTKLKIGDNKEVLGTDIYYARETEKGDKVFLENYSDMSGVGDLTISRGFEKEAINHDVYDFYIKNDNEIYYFKDFSSSSLSGDLWKYNSKSKEKNERIDYDVQGVLSY